MLRFSPKQKRQKRKKKRDPAVPRLPYTKGKNNIDQNRLHAGRIFSFPSKLPWEFTVEHPIRSIFPLWATYELPMSLLKWFYTEIGSGSPPPHLVYYALRGGMFLLSFVLEDWAIYELVPSPRHRRATVVLVASSYVTWTYQTHTFSNSLETLLVAWGLVLIRRIVENKVRAIKLRGHTVHANFTPSDTRPSSPTPCLPSSPWWASSTASLSQLSFYSRACNCCLSSSASTSICIHFASSSNQYTSANPAFAPDHSRSQHSSSLAFSFPLSQSTQTRPSTGRHLPSSAPSATP